MKTTNLIYLQTLLLCLFGAADATQVCYNINLTTSSCDGVGVPPQGSSFVIAAFDGQMQLGAFEFLPRECWQLGTCLVKYCFDVDLAQFDSEYNVPTLLIEITGSTQPWAFSATIDGVVVTPTVLCVDQAYYNPQACYCAGYYAEWVSYLDITANTKSLFKLSAPLRGDDDDGKGASTGLVSGILAAIALVMFIMAGTITMRRRKAKKIDEDNADLKMVEIDVKQPNQATPKPLPLAPPSTVGYSRTSSETSSIYSLSPPPVNKPLESRNPRHFSGDGSSLSTFYSRNFTSRKSVMVRNPSVFSVDTYKTLTSDEMEHRMSIIQFTKSKAGSKAGSKTSTVMSLTPVLSPRTIGKMVRLRQAIVGYVITLCEKDLGYKDITAGETPSTTAFTRGDDNGALLRKIPLPTFLEKLIFYVNKWTEDNNEGDSLGVKVLLVGYIYLTRLKKKYPELAVNDANIRNMLFVGVIIGTKFLDDWIIPNRYWADLVGSDVETLNEMERKFCHSLEYDFNVSEKHLRTVLKRIETMDERK